MKKLIIIVIYNIKIKDSVSLNSIKNVLHKYDNLDILLFENSSKYSDFNMNYINIYSSRIKYYLNLTNSGVAGAYKYVYDNYIEKYNFFITLDQDTFISEYYLQTVNLISNEKTLFIPKIYQSNKLISPYNDFVLIRKYICPLLPRFMAINSGLIIPKEIFKLVGVNETFWLDFYDYWFFSRIWKLGVKSHVINISINHKLSVFNNMNRSNSRYDNIIKYEELFYRNYSQTYYPVYKLKKLFRGVKDKLRSLL